MPEIKEKYWLKTNFKVFWIKRIYIFNEKTRGFEKH